GWEQTVSAVEDPELVEQALGGPDTSARLRRMHRVYVREDSVDGCGAAFADLVAELRAGIHSFDDALVDPTLPLVEPEEGQDPRSNRACGFPAHGLPVVSRSAAL